MTRILEGTLCEGGYVEFERMQQIIFTMAKEAGFANLPKLETAATNIAKELDAAAKGLFVGMSFCGSYQVIIQIEPNGIWRFELRQEVICYTREDAGNLRWNGPGRYMKKVKALGKPHFGRDYQQWLD